MLLTNVETLPELAFIGSSHLAAVHFVRSCERAGDLRARWIMP